MCRCSNTIQLSIILFYCSVFSGPRTHSHIFPPPPRDDRSWGPNEFHISPLLSCHWSTHGWGSPYKWDSAGRGLSRWQLRLKHPWSFICLLQPRQDRPRGPTVVLWSTTTVWRATWWWVAMLWRSAAADCRWRQGFIQKSKIVFFPLPQR